MANNLAKALLQIEQSVEKRFLRMPLGDSQKTPDKKRTAGAGLATNGGVGVGVGENGAPPTPNYTVLQNWERSLMYVTSLSQLFVHLQTLTESIAWAKSVLNARCRLCSRKGDAEKMLLCDKCDRGHHIYCLRPPLALIPDGEWFCPKCKPKDVEKTPRKVRKSFVATDDMNSDDEASREAPQQPTRKQNASSRAPRKVDESQEEDEDDENDDDDDDNEDELEESDDALSNNKKTAVISKTRAKPTSGKVNGHVSSNGHVSEEDERAGGASRKRKLPDGKWSIFSALQLIKR